MNIQNIPREDKTIKRAFIPKRDAFLFFDYEQIEYRLLAFYLARDMKDDSMAQIFHEGQDVHAATAASIFDKPISEVTSHERQVGKTFNFLTIYGGGAAKAAASLNMDIKQAVRMQKAFHEAWPAIKRLHNPPFANGGYRLGEGPGALQEVLLKRGYLKTPWGRFLQPRAAYAALNTLIQGAAADLIRSSMVIIHKWMMQELGSTRIVNVIHDEFMLDVFDNEIDLLVNEVPAMMKPTILTEVLPIEVSCEIARKSWADKAPFPH
jgi:DNA polymerase-1